MIPRIPRDPKKVEANKKKREEEEKALAANVIPLTAAAKKRRGQSSEGPSEKKLKVDSASLVAMPPAPAPSSGAALPATSSSASTATTYAPGPEPVLTTASSAASSSFSLSKPRKCVLCESRDHLLTECPDLQSLALDVKRKIGDLEAERRRWRKTHEESKLSNDAMKADLERTRQELQDALTRTEEEREKLAKQAEASVAAYSETRSMLDEALAILDARNEVVLPVKYPMDHIRSFHSQLQPGFPLPAVCVHLTSLLRWSTGSDSALMELCKKACSRALSPHEAVAVRQAVGANPGIRQFLRDMQNLFGKLRFWFHAPKAAVGALSMDQTAAQLRTLFGLDSKSEVFGVHYAERPPYTARWPYDASIAASCAVQLASVLPEKALLCMLYNHHDDVSYGVGPSQVPTPTSFAQTLASAANGKSTSWLVCIRYQEDNGEILPRIGTLVNKASSS